MLLGENYVEIKAWHLKFPLVDPYFYEKLHWNKSLTAKVFWENLVKAIFETAYLSQSFDDNSWY